MDMKEYKKINQENLYFLLNFLMVENKSLASTLKHCRFWFYTNSNKINVFLHQAELFYKKINRLSALEVANFFKNHDKIEALNIDLSFVKQQQKSLRHAQNNQYIFNLNLPIKKMIVFLNKDAIKAFSEEKKAIDFSFFHEMSHLIMAFRDENQFNEIRLNPYVYNTILVFQKKLKQEKKWDLANKLDIENILESYADLMSLYLIHKKYLTTNPINYSSLANELINKRIEYEIKFKDYSHNTTYAINSSLEKNLFSLPFNLASEIFFYESIKSFYIKVKKELMNNCDKTIYQSLINVLTNNNFDKMPQNITLNQFMLNILDDSKHAFKNELNKSNRFEEYIDIIDKEIVQLEKEVEKISHNYKNQVKYKNKHL